VEADAATVQCLGILKDALGQADLCGRCARALLDWIRRGQAPEPEPITVPGPSHSIGAGSAPAKDPAGDDA
jgi:hypothetical protein